MSKLKPQQAKYYKRGGHMPKATLLDWIVSFMFVLLPVFIFCHIING